MIDIHLTKGVPMLRRTYELWPDTEGKDRPAITVH